MKKIIILCLSFFFTITHYGQQVYVNGPTNIEVGIYNNFQFTFSATGLNSFQAFKVDNWTISSNNANINYTGNSNWNTYSQSNTYLGIGTNAILYVPIKWDDNSNNSTDSIKVTATVSFRDSNGNWSSQSDFSYNIYKNNDYYPYYDVNILRISAPTISTPTILKCCSDNVQFVASNYGNSNMFNWYYIIGGIIISGQGTSTITVAPDTSISDIIVKCNVGRSSASITYQKFSTNVVPRTSRTIDINILGNPTYTCNSLPIIAQVPNQCGMISTTFTATNCTISPVTLINGVRQATITPNSSLVGGSSIEILATSIFASGCTAYSNPKSVIYYKNETPQIPNGNITFTTSGTTCNPSAFIAQFTPSSSSPFTNGKISISPSVIIPGKGSGSPYQFQVCYTNLCNNLRTCKTFTAGTPTPCISNRNSNIGRFNSTLLIYPNPTNGNFNIQLPEIVSGNYQIFDEFHNTLIKESKFNNQSELQIELSNQLKAGIYIIKVITENNIFSDKIILNK